LGKDLVKGCWDEGRGVDVKRVREVMEGFVREKEVEAKGDGVELRGDYVSVNLTDGLREVSDGEVGKDRGLILSGAIWVGKTRLIDNIVLGVELN
jgi:pantoate--beta-alanine ligase